MSIRYLRCCCLILLLLGGRAAAAATVGLHPPERSFRSGESVTFELVVSDLDRVLAAFDISLGYDPDLLGAIAIDFGLLLGDPDAFDAVINEVLTAPGQVILAETSMLDGAALAPLQDPAGGAWRLATINFTALVDGTTAPWLSYIALSDADALPIEVPVPGPWALLAVGALWAGSRRPR